MARDSDALGPTRARDLLVVALVAALAAYALTRFNYNSFPRLPRLAGATAALLGIGEAIMGFGLRSRIRAREQALRSQWGGLGGAGPDARGSGAYGDSRPVWPGELPPPVPPLVAARALAVAKASALGAAAFAGLWIGFGAYVLPSASRADIPAADSVTALIGLLSALMLLAGALWLESCCRTPSSSA